MSPHMYTSFPVKVPYTSLEHIWGFQFKGNYTNPKIDFLSLSEQMNYYHHRSFFFMSKNKKNLILESKWNI